MKLGRVGAAVGLILVALASVGVTSRTADAQNMEFYPPGFKDWPRELASRAPALADSIEHDFGERPYGIHFLAPDQITVVIRNPGFFRKDMVSKGLPNDSLASVRQAGQHIVEYVWRTFAHDKDIEVVAAMFVRLRREQSLLFSHDVATHYMSYSLDRAHFELGHPEMGMISWTSPENTPPSIVPPSPAPGDAPRPDLFVRGPLELAPRGFALGDSIERIYGERPHEIEFAGKDTIIVTFWNPTFWRNDMQTKEFPRASLPLVRQTAERVGGFLWSNYGREAGINVIRVTFVRMRRVNTGLLTGDVPVQELTGQLTRKQLETGPPRLVSLTMTQR